MKSKTIIVLVSFLITLNITFGQGFLPMYHKLPPKGQYVKLSPMIITDFRNQHLKIDYQNYDKKNNGKYYGVLEFSENFCQYSIYDNTDSLILKRFGNPDKDLFIKEISSLGEKFNLISLTKVTKNTTCNIRMHGEKDYPNLVKQSVEFDYFMSSENGTLIDVINMEYEFAKK